MEILGKILGWTLGQIVNFISDLLFLFSRPLYKKFGLWITSLMEDSRGG